MPLRIARFRELDNVTLYALLRLRGDVFVVEQGCAYPDLDGRDLESETLHLWFSHAEAPVAYLRVLREPDGGARIGRVVTALESRNRGHAARLMTRALEVLGPDTPCVLEAQSHAVSFYARFGFTASGREYIEDGIVHVTMRRSGPIAEPTTLGVGNASVTRAGEIG
jgi:ElaA protein